MTRLTVIVVGGMLLLGFGCNSSDAHRLEHFRAPGLPTCRFDVGDTVSRGGIGAVVQSPGQGVIGNADGVDSWSEIEVGTSKDGVVTIASRSSNAPTSRREVCLLRETTSDSGW